MSISTLSKSLPVGASESFVSCDRCAIARTVTVFAGLPDGDVDFADRQRLLIRLEIDFLWLLAVDGRIVRFAPSRSASRCLCRVELMLGSGGVSSPMLVDGLQSTRASSASIRSKLLVTKLWRSRWSAGRISMDSDSLPESVDFKIQSLGH